MTGVDDLGPSDHLASAGVDSLNLYELVGALRASLGVTLPDVWLMANPTIGDLAARADALAEDRRGSGEAAKKAEAVALNSAAISGFRGLLALGVVRGHLFVYCPGHWRDDGVGYGDMFQFWRTVVFMRPAASADGHQSRVSLFLSFVVEVAPGLRQERPSIPSASVGSSRPCP